MTGSKKSGLKDDLESLLLGDEESERSSPLGSASPNQVILGGALATRPRAPSALDQPKTKIPSDPTMGKTAVVTQYESASPPVNYDHLKLAQDRILQLEREIDSLRLAQEAGSAGQSSAKNANEKLQAKLADLESKSQGLFDDKNLEIQKLRETLSKRESHIELLSSQVKELESRFQGEFSRVRIKERELQNRLDLIKIEHSAVMRSKDETLLDLKRQLDLLQGESDSARTRMEEQISRVAEQDERVKRAIKALRLAISLLVGEDGSSVPLK